MELKEFTEYLVKSIVNNPDKVRVSEFKLEDDLIIEVLVSDDDRSVVIGKGGKMANAIRTLVQAHIWLIANIFFFLNFMCLFDDSFESTHKIFFHCI